MTRSQLSRIKLARKTILKLHAAAKKAKRNKEAADLWRVGQHLFMVLGAEPKPRKGGQ